MDKAPQGDLFKGDPLNKANLSPTAGISVQTRPKKKSQLMPFTKSFHLDPKGKCIGKITAEGAHGRTTLDPAARSQTEPHATSRRGQHAFVALSLDRGRKHQSNAVELFRVQRSLGKCFHLQLLQELFLGWS